MDKDIQAVAQQVTAYSLEEYEAGVRAELAESTVTSTAVVLAMNKFETAYSNYYALVLARRKAKALSQTDSAQALKLKIEAEQSEVYKQFFQFQNIFNEYFNQKITMVFVDLEKHQLTVADNDLSHVIQNQFGSLEYQINEASAALLKNFEYDSSRLDVTSDSVYQRWEAAKRELKRSVGLPIIWKIGPNEYDGRKVNNKGTIAEAYANFYLNSVELPSTNLEQNVGTFVVNEEYGMASVDNTLGFAIGDISRGGINQYAVKSNRAGLMGMHRVYQYVKKIKAELGTGDDHALVKALMEKVSQPGTVKQVTHLASASIKKEAESLISILGLE